jgi:tRNA threonylcarbamoyladenosine biosynthesis protein TsaB
MKVLAIDTATEALSVALHDGKGVCAHRYEVIGRGHAERVLPLVNELLAERGWKFSDLTAIAVGRGPGAFTGVRIGISVAQGLAFGLGIPAVGVSDLEAVALGALERAAASGISAEAILVAMDARMGEVYAGYYEVRGGGLDRQFEELCRPEELAGRLERCDALILAGHGYTAYPTLRESLAGAAYCFEDALPDARYIVEQGVRSLAEGEAVEAHLLEPVYLRDEVATRSARSHG